MHISGKIAAWLVAVGIVVAFYFSVKALSIRDKWMALAQKNEAEIKKNDEEIAKKIRLRDEKRTSLARTMFGWDRYWLDVPVTGNAASTLAMQLGTSRGIQQNQVVYVFIPNADGTATYVGDFKVTKVADNQCETNANSRRRPGDAKQVTAQNARVRTLIPTPFLARLGALDQQLLAAELTVATNNNELKRQGTLFEQSEKLIETRMAELNGNPALANRPLPAVNVIGLLTGIVEEEEARNAALIEADRLMRELKAARDSFAKIREENAARVQSLPQPPAAEPALGAVGR
ncbi:MAG: hypothetical protein ACM3U2_18215 [Deltaproteobacteria bacterium]